MKYRHEYRINKKGSECFRTESFEIAQNKMQELSKNRPGVYTMQERHCALNKVGALLTDGCNKPLWTCWH